MADQLQNKYIDKRVFRRYLRANVIDEKEYERYVKSLPDLTEQAMPIEASIEGAQPDEGGVKE